jgi:multidrug efflux pump subunit AcrA (membrane-fusion protein)
MNANGAVRMALAILACVLALLPVSGLHADQPVHEIAHRDLFHTLDRACLIEPGEPVHIAAPLDGRLELLVQEGDHVTEGGLIGLYQSGPLERELTLAQSRQAMVAARLAQIAGPLTDAQRQLQALDTAATERRFAEAKDAHERLVELAGDGRVAERRSLESAEALQQIADDLTRARMQSLIFGIETELQIAELRNTALEAQATVDKLQEQLEQSRLISPVTGQVSYADPRLAGAGVAAVQAGRQVVAISQPHRRWARVGMTPAEAERMRSGSVAIIDHDGQEFAAAIQRVVLREDAAGWEKERFQFIVAFDAPEGAFLVGSDAICAFRRLAARASVAAPLHFLLHDADDAIALRIDGDLVERVSVTTGIVAPPFVEITGGLEPGDRIRQP